MRTVYLIPAVVNLCLWLNPPSLCSLATHPSSILFTLSFSTDQKTFYLCLTTTGIHRRSFPSYTSWLVLRTIFIALKLTLQHCLSPNAHIANTSINITQRIIILNAAGGRLCFQGKQCPNILICLSNIHGYEVHVAHVFLYWTWRLCIILICLSSNQRAMNMSLTSNWFNWQLISNFSLGNTTLGSLPKHFFDSAWLLVTGISRVSYPSHNS